MAGLQNARTNVVDQFDFLPQITQIKLSQITLCYLCLDLCNLW